MTELWIIKEIRRRYGPASVPPPYFRRMPRRIGPQQWQWRSTHG